MEKDKQDVADLIFKRGAIKYGPFPPGRSVHGQNCPPPPYRLDLLARRDSEPGSWNFDDCESAARLTWVAAKGIQGFNTIAGFSDTGRQLVDALECIIPIVEYRYLKFIGTGKNATACLAPEPGVIFYPGGPVLLVHDQIAGGESELKMIRQIEALNFKVAGLAVLVDGQQGGRELLEGAGHEFASAFTISELLEYYRTRQMVDDGHYYACQKFLESRAN